MNQPTIHPGDDLEAYALGMLGTAEGAAIEAHVATCDACLRQLGEAERGVAAMLEIEAPALARPPVQIHQIRRFAFVGALAAAAVIGILTDRVISLNGDVRGDGQLVQAMIASHFVHAQFRAADGRELDAKVVYERHGHWYEILASDATLRVAVVARLGDAPRLLDERFQRRGDAAVLRAPVTMPVQAFELRDESGRTLGRVDLPQERER